jgi:hypothetical protein
MPCSGIAERPQSASGPHQLYQALKAQLAEDVPEDVLWDDDEGDYHGPPTNAKEVRAEMEKQELIQRLERRLGLEEQDGAGAAPGGGEAPGPQGFGGWDGPATRRGALLRGPAALVASHPTVTTPPGACCRAERCPVPAEPGQADAARAAGRASSIFLTPAGAATAHTAEAQHEQQRQQQQEAAPGLRPGSAGSRPLAGRPAFGRQPSRLGGHAMGAGQGAATLGSEATSPLLGGQEEEGGGASSGEVTAVVRTVQVRTSLTSSCWVLAWAAARLLCGQPVMPAGR